VFDLTFGIDVAVQDAIKTALLLGAIDREIGGIAISGKRGTAKTVIHLFLIHLVLHATKCS
jgi:Mg-chelatase subunit ChlI